jgi:predicted transcriptional regulator
MLTDFLSKMHNADMAVKRLNFENSALRNNSRLLLRNMIMVSLKLKEKNLGDLSKAVGIPQDQLKPFLESLIEDKFIVKEEDIYKLN